MTKVLHKNLVQWQGQFCEGLRSPAEVACEFVLVNLYLKHSHLWLGAPTQCRSTLPLHQHQAPLNSVPLIDRLVKLGLTFNSAIMQRLTGVHDYSQLLRSFQLKGIREDSRLGLLGWLDGCYPLHLLDFIPTPKEMLNYQCVGQRVVTLLFEPNIQFVPIGRHAGAFEFLLHDLEHAEKFFGKDHSTSGQIYFFKKVKLSLNSSFFNSPFCDPQFNAQLDYLLSDMNSHPVHLIKYFKAIVLSAIKRTSRGCHEDHIETLFANVSRKFFTNWNLPSDVLDSVIKINYPHLETNSVRLCVADYFNQCEMQESPNETSTI